MGSLSKRYRLPACLASEVSEPGSAPVRTRIVDVDLVVFRGHDDNISVLYEYCLHRGVSLALARNEPDGLRCIYHGWKFAGDGKLVEMPTEPTGSRAKERMCADAYPVVESGGLIWVYLGPKDSMPAFQPMPWADVPARGPVVMKAEVNANRAQAFEGQIDSAHSSQLHSTDITIGRENQTVSGPNGTLVRPSGESNPKLIVKRASYGMRYVAIRRPKVDPENHDYMRVTVFIAPCFALIPPNARNALCNIQVPRDDGHTAFTS